MTIRNNQYISLNKTEKNTEAARFHFSKEMVVAIVTCAIALIALLPINEVLTDMLLCAMDVPDEDWQILKTVARVFVVLIAAGLSAVAYSRATDED
ncbi:MAG: hypothetical protein IKN72_07935 [Clostridia bacterium]|nr:hypothetical protein [Clostridia bacterium]MBR3553303.1 hypothetical protein [Clostridia bacterium]